MLIGVLHGFSTQAQDIYDKYNIYRNPIRLALNKVSWTVTSGFGGTRFSHDLEGLYFAQDAFGQYISTSANQPSLFTGYQNWLSGNVVESTLNLDNIYDTPYVPISNPVNNPDLIQRGGILPVNADSLGLSFASTNVTIPIGADLHFNIYKFRLGFGFQWERIFMSPLHPTVGSVGGVFVRDYQPEFDKTSNTKIYGMLGYQFYEWWNYTFALELRLGRSSLGKPINTSALAIGQNFFTNLSVNIEKNLSEYFRIIVRPGLDFKSYVVNIPDDQASSIRHSNLAFIVNVGVSFNIPEIPRSPMKSDHVQLKHIISDPNTGRLMEVRGQPFWKVQNPKVGENHRKLWRYKWMNRRKIDPY